MSTEATHRITVTEPAEANGTRLDPGTYWVRMPASYDPDAVTGVDILCDRLVYIVDGPDPMTYLEIWKDNGTGVWIVSPEEGIATCMFPSGDALTDCRTYRQAWCPEEADEIDRLPATDITDEPQSTHLATYRPAKADALEIHQDNVVDHIARYLGIAE